VSLAFATKHTIDDGYGYFLMESAHELLVSPLTFAFWL
jgi:hypothetical protein